MNESTKTEEQKHSHIEFADKKRARFKTVKLEWPLLVDDETLSEITITRLTGKDVIELQKMIDSGKVGDAKLLSLFSDLSTDVVNALDSDDLIRFREAAFDFLPNTMGVAPASQTQEA